MYENNYQKYLELWKRILTKIKPRFSFHYVAYTTLFIIVIFSVVELVGAATPNPGHPWSELGDGVFVFTSGQTATPYTYTFPAANTTVLTTNASVTVGQGGTGNNAIALGSVFAANSADTLTAVTSTTGTKVLTNTAGVISWENTASGMTWPAGGAGIPNYSGSSSWGTSYTTSGSGSVLALNNSPSITTPTFVTNATVPLLIGGSAVGSNITYQSTTGAGTTTGIAHQFTGGTNGGTVIQTMLNNGNVGIGTTAPLSTLNIAGTTGISWGPTMNSTGLVTIGTGGAVGGSLWVNTQSLNSDYQSGFGVTGTYQSPQTARSVINLNAYGVSSTGGYGSDFAFSTTREGVLYEAMRIDMNGRVGIGTTAPIVPLDVWGSVEIGATANNEGFTARDLIGSDVYSLTRQSGAVNGDLSISAFGGVGLTGGRTANNPATTNYSLYVNNAGNVGIGTTDPGEALDVVGDIQNSTGDFITTNGSLRLLDSTSAVVFRGVRANSWTDNVSSRFFQIGSQQDNVVLNTANGWAAHRLMINSASTQVADGSYATANAPAGIFEVSDGTQGLFNVMSYGNVGIGTTVPTAYLHLKAGLATTGNAPLKFTNGTLNTTPENGAVEYDGIHYYGSIGVQRYQLDRQASIGLLPSKGLLLGDSTVATYSGLNPIDTYLLTTSDTLAGTTITNAAVSGHTIAQQEAVWTADGNKSTYDWIAIMVGLNDLNTPAESAATVIARYQTLINTINAGKKAGAIIIVSTMTPDRQWLINTHGGVDGPLAYQKWLDINTAIMGGGATPVTGVNYRVNNHTLALNDGAGNLAQAYDNGDYIHENNAGRAVVASEWRSVLKTAGFLTATPPTIYDKYFSSSTTNTFLKGGNLGLGTTNPEVRLDIANDGIIRVQRSVSANPTRPTTGVGLELEYANTADSAIIRSYDRTGAAYKPLYLNGSSIILNSTGSPVGVGNVSPSALLTLGTAGTTAGTLSLAGLTSGTTTLAVPSAAGSYTFTLPSSGGSSGHVLSTNGSGTTSWIPNGSGSSQWTTQGNHIYYNVASGNVGIGLTAPAAKLEITDTAISGRETPLRVSVSDASSVFGVKNSTATDGVFEPSFYGASVASDRYGLIFQGMTTAANDTASDGLMGFFSMIHSGDPVNGSFSDATNRQLFNWGDSNSILMVMDAAGRLAIGDGVTPTARLHLGAGTATAGTAPLKITSSAGALLGTTEAGAMEFDGTHLYFTLANGGTRYQLDQQSGGSSTLQTAYNLGGIIETSAGTPVTITETTAVASTHNLLGLTVNPLTTGTFTGDALNIVMDAVDLGANTGNGLHIVVDQSQATGFPILVEDDAGVDILSLSQTAGLTVGSLTNRMNTTTYGDFVSVGADIQTNLTGIIDMFVYDTTRDSDGGEWRNSLLSQQLSWYGEAKDDGVNNTCDVTTEDRCGLSEFPRKAIIVTTADALYIFRADNNLLWMKFSQAGTYALGADLNNNPSGVGAQNGVVVVGTNGTAGTGMYAIDFKQDVMYRYNTTNRSQGDKNIANRNTAVTYGSINAETGFLIANNIVNDVSIAVQTASNEGSAGTIIAPIDSQAGPVRGVTIIAVATDSGVNVINMGTRKSILYSDTANNDYNQVVMTTRGRMYATNEELAQLEEWKGVDTVSVAQTTPTRVYDETVGKSPITLTVTAPTMSTSPGSLAVIERGSSARESAAAGQADSGDIVFVGTNQGLAEVHTSGGTLPAASWSKVTSKDVATPYMVGAVRAAYLFDEASGATFANSAISSTTTNRMQSPIVGTAPTFQSDGVRGKAVAFNNNSYLCSDSTNDGICDGNTIFNSAAVSFTISLWFKHSTTAAADTLFERCYTPATPTVVQPCMYAGMTSTGAIRWGINTTATAWTYATTYTDTQISTALYNDNQWHHAVFVNTDTDTCLYIDGRQAAACDTSIAGTVSLDAAQVLTIGGSCAGAACVTGANFWDGSIDDFVWSSLGATTDSGLTAQSVSKLYLDGRAHLIRPSDTVADADTFTSTTIGKSGKTYTPGSFVGLIVELTGGTGIGQTRTIISNDATTFTVYPAFTTPPDGTTDYMVSPAKLYGATNNVTAISVDSPTSLNRVRKIYVGTDDNADGGGITSFTNAGAGSIKTEVIHSGSGFANDDYGNVWSGAGSDNITSIASYSDTAVFGNDIFFRSQRKDVSLKQLQTDMIGSLEDIRMELVAQGLFGSTQDVLGLGQGADLAEYYYSNTKLEPGDVVAIQPDQPAGIGKSSSRYQKNLLGVVSTRPGLTLGPVAENAYPIALGGRIPVKITNENGEIHVGDMLTSSSKEGYAMKATMAGAVLGKVINEPEAMTSCDIKEKLTIEEAIGDGPGVVTNTDGTVVEEKDIKDTTTQKEEEIINPNAPKCGYAMLFVGLSDSLGSDVVKLAEEYATAKNANGLMEKDEEGLSVDSVSDDLENEDEDIDEKELILDFLKAEKEAHLNSGFDLQSIYTDRLAAAIQIITPEVITDDLYVGNIAEFALPPLFNKDTAGFAIIKEGDRRVRVEFENPYIAEPAVGAMLVFNVADKISDTLAGDLFENKVESMVVDSDNTGFTILINKDAPRDLRYAWNAFQVKDAKVFESVVEGLKIEMETEESLPEEIKEEKVDNIIENKDEILNAEDLKIDTLLDPSETTPVVVEEVKDEVVEKEAPPVENNSDINVELSSDVNLDIESGGGVSIDTNTDQ